MFCDKEDAQRRASPWRDRRWQYGDRRGLFTNARWIFGLRLTRGEKKGKKRTCDQRRYRHNRGEPARCNHLIPLPGKVPLPRTIPQNRWLNNGKIFRTKCRLFTNWSCRQTKPCPSRAIDTASITINHCNFLFNGKRALYQSAGMPGVEETGGTRSDRMPIAVLDQHPAQKTDFQRHAMPV